MAKIHDMVYMDGEVIPQERAVLHVASSAVLYGLSIYTVFPLIPTQRGIAAFRLRDHYDRLVHSARIIGIDTFAPAWTFERFRDGVRELAEAHSISDRVFARATVHVTECVPGTRSRGLRTSLSIFLYEANPILTQQGARLKTSVWRRVPDYAIPSRAKVNGAYINSVLGKQDAIDSGYDDCVFLDTQGSVCELSAANIFLVRNGTLLTPGRSSDILEGINRRTVLELAGELSIPVEERTIDLTELYVADEVFACGTSAYVAPVIEIDARVIGGGTVGPITERVRQTYANIFSCKGPLHARYLDLLGLKGSDLGVL